MLRFWYQWDEKPELLSHEVIQEEDSITQNNVVVIQESGLSNDKAREILDTYIADQEVQDQEIEQILQEVEREKLEIQQIEREVQQIERKPISVLHENNTVPKWEEFPQVRSGWGENLNPTNLIPSTGFTAVYFNTETREVAKTVAQESIYVYELGHSAGDIYDLGVYFIGNIGVSEPGIFEFPVSQSWASTRLIIDGKDVSSILRSAEPLLYLQDGNYTMEVEFINDWHVADFSLWFQPQQQKYTLYELEKKLQYIDALNADIWFAWVYESGNPDDEIILEIPKHERDIVLFLGSYSPVNWNISNPFNTSVRAIVFGWYITSGIVLWNIGNAEIYQMDEQQLPIIYEILPSCSDFWWTFYCEWDIREFNELRNISTRIFWEDLSWFKWAYSPKILELPGDILNPQKLWEIENDMRELEIQKQNAENPKSFDDIF